MYEEDAGATQVFNADDPLMGVEWSVNVSDDDTRTMRAPDIAYEYLRGGLDPNDTFVWRDGMGDWIPLGECQELLDVIRQYEGGHASPAPSQAQPDPNAGPSDPYAAAGAPSYAEAARSAAPPPSAPAGDPYGGVAYDPHAEGDDDELGSTMMMDPSAQNLVEQAQQAQGVAAYPTSQPAPDEVSQTMASPFDLGDEDPFADARPPEAGDSAGGPRRVGERNEASALFSLDQIRAEAESASHSSGGASGGASDDPFADIMSLGGGGGIAGAFAPPPINAPAPPPPPPKPTPAPVQASLPPAPGSMAPAASMPPPGSMPASMPGSMPAPMAASMPAPQQKSRKGLVIGAVAAILLLGGGVAAFALSGGSEPETTAETAETDGPTPGEEGSEESADEEKVAEADGSDEDAAEEDEADEADDDKAGDDDADDEKTAKSDDEDGGKTASTKTTSTTSSSKDDKTDKKDDKKDAKTEKKDDKKDDKVAKAEFNRDAARSALAGAAGAASGCKKKGGPTGRGRVVVTFAPSGRATQATVGPPFAGTAVGSCAAGAFRGASVPPFSGGPVTVSKSFFIK